MGGSYVTRPVRPASLQSACDLFHSHFVESNANHGSHHQPNHLVQKTIARNFDRHVCCSLPHLQGGDRAHCAFLFLSPIRGVRGKIVLTNKHSTSCCQQVNVQWLRDVPNSVQLKRRQNGCRPNSITISLAGRRKSRVKLRRNKTTPQNANRWRQRGIERSCPIPGR